LDGRRGMVERMPSHIPATEAASDINELLRTCLKTGIRKRLGKAEV